MSRRLAQHLSNRQSNLNCGGKRPVTLRWIFSPLGALLHIVSDPSMPRLGAPAPLCPNVARLGGGGVGMGVLSALPTMPGILPLPRAACGPLAEADSFAPPTV